MTANPVYRIIHFIARNFFRFYGRWRIIGRDKLPKSGPVIIAPNHVSYLDPPLAGAAIPRKCAFMARHDLFEPRWLKWLLPRINTFPVKRGQPDRNAIRLALAALERGECLVMFPEGGRTTDGLLQKGESGVALIVQKSGAPVVPVALIGPELMLPVGGKKLKRVPLKVVFGDPLFFTPDSSREEVVTAIMRAIAALLTANGQPAVAAEDREAATVTA